MKTSTKVLIGVGVFTGIAVGAYFLFRDKFDFFKPQDDAKRPEVSNEGPLDPITVTNTSDEEILGMVESMTADFQKSVANICANVPTVNPAGYMRLVVNIARNKQQAKELMAIMDEQGFYTRWVESTLDTSTVCGITIGQMIVDATEHFEEKCAQTTFVDNVTEDTVSETVVTNTSKKAFLGAVKKNTTEKTTTERKTVSHCMVPHCTDYVIDVGKLKAKLGMLQAAVTAAYNPYIVAYNSEPDITAFVDYLNMSES